MAVPTFHQMSHGTIATPRMRATMFEPERWATKGRTVGGYVPVTHANVWSSTQHSNSGMMVQLAYHRLYNRPASPLSCLCSSSCSSPLLNKTQVWRWFTSTGQKIALTEDKSEFLFIAGRVRREPLLLLACAVGQTPDPDTGECSWPGRLPNFIASSRPPHLTPLCAGVLCIY